MEKPVDVSEAPGAGATIENLDLRADAIGPGGGREGLDGG